MATLQLDPAADTNAVGENHTVTGTVEDAEGQPVEGQQVAFELYRPPETAEQDRHVGVTDQSGEVTYTYTGPDTPAEDSILACTEQEVNADVRDQCVDQAGFDDAGDLQFQESDTAVYGTASETWLLASELPQ